MIKIKTFNDDRGEMKFLDVNPKIKQKFLSINNKNVIRGIHVSPYGKYITIISGKVFDYVINFKDNSYIKYKLNENQKIYVPPNYGHMFVSLIEHTIVMYELEGEYDEKKEINLNYREPILNLDIPSCENYIISEKDSNIPFINNIDYIVLGSNGFLGSYTCEILTKYNKKFITLKTRLNDIDILKKQLQIYKPKYVICAAGISGNPSVMWCEENKEITKEVNYDLQLELANICKELNIHLTIYGSGLIYTNDGLYNEESEPNFDLIYYSKMRIKLEKALDYSNILYLRILYPIVGNDNPKCFLNKIKSRIKTVHNIKINVTVLPDLLPKMLDLIENGHTGIFNFVNPNLISIIDIINIMDDKLEYNVTKTIINVPELDVTKLKTLFPEIKNVDDAIKEIL